MCISYGIFKYIETAHKTNMHQSISKRERWAQHHEKEILYLYIPIHQDQIIHLSPKNSKIDTSTFSGLLQKFLFHICTLYYAWWRCNWRHSTIHLLTGNITPHHSVVVPSSSRFQIAQYPSQDVLQLPWHEQIKVEPDDKLIMVVKSIEKWLHWVVCVPKAHSHVIRYTPNCRSCAAKIWLDVWHIDVRA